MDTFPDESSGLTDLPEVVRDMACRSYERSWIAEWSNCESELVNENSRCSNDGSWKDKCGHEKV